MEAGHGSPECASPPKVIHRATGETGFGDVVFDLVSVQYHALKGVHDYGQYVRDARNGGYDEIASFFEEVMREDSGRARRCHQLLADPQRIEGIG